MTVRPDIFVRNNVLYGADQSVADMVKALCGLVCQWDHYAALGVVRDHALIGGVVFHDYRPQAADIEITAGFTTPRWCSPATFGEIMRYPLVQLDLERCTARVASGNHPARRFLERLGFIEEGRLRRGRDGVQDDVIYGVLREEGRWRRTS